MGNPLNKSGIPKCRPHELLLLTQCQHEGGSRRPGQRPGKPYARQLSALDVIRRQANLQGVFVRLDHGTHTLAGVDFRLDPA